MFARAAYCAGALTGLAEGTLRNIKVPPLTSHNQRIKIEESLETKVCIEFKPHKILLNIVLLGEKGAGQASLAQWFLGTQCEPQTCFQRTGFVMLHTRCNRIPVTIAVWHISGGRQDAIQLGEEFFSKANGYIIVYDPLQEDPTESLDYWNTLLLKYGCQSESIIACAILPAVGSSPAGCDAGERWAMKHTLSHFVIDGLIDSQGIVEAKQYSCTMALEQYAKKLEGLKGAMHKETLDVLKSDLTSMYSAMNDQNVVFC